MSETTGSKQSDEQTGELDCRMRVQLIAARIARRARIVPLAADRVDNHDIARRREINRGQVIPWRNYFPQRRVMPIGGDLPHGGRSLQIDAAKIVRLTTETPPETAAHWITRKLAVHEERVKEDERKRITFFGWRDDTSIY